MILHQLGLRNIDIHKRKSGAEAGKQSIYDFTSDLMNKCIRKDHWRKKGARRRYNTDFD